MMSNASPVKWRHFEAEIMLLCVRWCLRYTLSYPDLAEMLAEHGLSMDHRTIFRWVQPYTPELDKRCRPHLKAATDSWKVDETSIEVKKVSKPAPCVINVDTNAASPKAMADLKAAGVLLESVELHQVKYLNNQGEHDHRFIVYASPTVHGTWWVPVTHSTPPVL